MGDGIGFDLLVEIVNTLTFHTVSVLYRPLQSSPVLGPPGLDDAVESLQILF